MDAATLGAVLALAGTLAGTVVAFVGKRGENAIAGYSNLTNDLQEERDRLDHKITELHAEVAKAAGQHAADQAEIARLRAIIVNLGGSPP